MDSSNVVVRSLHDMFQAELESAKAIETIEPYRVDDNTYSGYACVCGQLFYSRKGSALRHCTRSGCDSSKLQKVELFKLCCDRYVSNTQVVSLFNEAPCFPFFQKWRNTITRTLTCTPLLLLNVVVPHNL